MIRTSGYYKQKGIGEELIPNADFELGSEGWIFKDFKKVDFTGYYAYCVYKGSQTQIYPDELIEIHPDDLLLLGLSVKPDNYSGTKYLKYVIYPTDKKNAFSYNYYEFLFTIQTGNINNYYRLFAASEIFKDNFNELWGMRVARAIVPTIISNWNDNESMYFRTISLQRIEPENLKVFPTELIDVNTSTPTKNHNYTGEKYLSGIFNEANYVVFVDKLENTSGSDSITLKIYVESYDVITGKYFTCALFEIEADADETLNDEVYTKVATAGLGFYQRIRWRVEGSGSPGDVVFKVGVTYKR